MTTHVERSIEVGVPVRAAYDQWTRFEEFPRFMSGVEEVRQVGDVMTHWVAQIAGVRREWDAEIVEQVPDEKVAWAATTGATNAGAVFFDRVGTDRTRVRLTLDFEPEGLVERLGDVLDVVDRQAVGDLDRFKEFIEGQGSAAGGWRGTIEDGDVVSETTGQQASTGTAGVASTREAADDVPGGVAVGPTGGTESTGTSTGRGNADDAGRTGTAAGAASSAAVAGFGTDTGLTSSAASGAFTGDPGARASSHAGTGTGDLVGDAGGRHEAWTDEPGARGDVTESVTDPVGEDWDAEGTSAARADAGPRSATTGTDAAWAAGGSGPGEDRGVRDTAGEGVVQRNYADEDITTDDVVARDFANRPISGEGVVERDFANRDITERDIANRGMTGEGHLDPLDPRSGTADDRDNPIEPSV